MNFWIVSDTHLGHEILRAYSGRPVDADERILRGLSVIDNTKGDVLVHLGDVCIGNDDKWHREIRKRTSGTMILVRGNHDKRSITWYLERGWDIVVDRFDLVMYGKRIAFSHIPLADDGSFDINIHGHFHNSDHHRWESEFVNRMTDKHRLIFLEHHYRPVTLKSVINRK